MGVFDGQENITALLFREDYRIDRRDLPVDEYNSDAFTMKKNAKRFKSWLLEHNLMKRCYGVPGIEDGKLAIMINERDIVWDIIDPDKYDDAAIFTRMIGMAKEQLHKAESKGAAGAGNVTQILMGTAALILFISIALVGVLKYYGG